jgi:hypothetical protein
MRNMTPQEAYEHYLKTDEDAFLFTKGKKTVRIVFVCDTGEVYAPSLKRHFLVQQFYDGWEAAAA